MNEFRTVCLDGAVMDLANAVNGAVFAEDVKASFLKVHPYLLNLIAKGLLLAVKDREGDGRPSIPRLKLILEG